jgi:membrane protein YdbS with pleckstrin-like domain
VFHRHWKWLAVRVVLSSLLAVALLTLALVFLGSFAWIGILGLLVVWSAVCYGFWMAWGIVSIAVESDKLVITEGFIRTYRLNIPVLNVQEYTQQYRSDIDRLLFHCVELRVMTAGEDPNPAFYPLEASAASALGQFLDIGRQQRPDDPVVRLQRQSVKAIQQLAALMIVNAERTGVPQRVLEQALAMAERGDPLVAIAQFVYASETPTIPIPGSWGSPGPNPR